MTTVGEIPLQPKAQTLSITLAGVGYNMLVYWCDPAQCWVLDLYDVAGIIIIAGIPLVTGPDLLAQFAYLKIGGKLIVQTDHDKDAVPTYADLGLTGHLYFVAP